MIAITFCGAKIALRIILPLLAIYEKIAVYLRLETEACGCVPHVVHTTANLFISVFFHLFFDSFADLFFFASSLFSDVCTPTSRNRDIYDKIN